LIKAAADALARRQGESRLCIANYHRILESIDPLLNTEPDVKMFRWQMELLAEFFHVMPLHDAVMALASRSIPPRAVCVTFDDGYRSMHELALPILKELDLPATVFVTTGHMQEGSMWNDRIVEAMRRLSSGVLDLADVGLGIYRFETIPERQKALDKLIHDSKYLPPQARLAVIQKLEMIVGDIPASQPMLSREMIMDLAQNGIEIGGHTVSHPILTRLDDAAARSEIIENKRHLEAIIEKPLRLFAYPNGKADVDFDERHVQMVKDAGYDAAFTTAIGPATNQHDRYRLPRSRPWDTTPFLFGLRLFRWLAL
jgi:peptidoglycan/xylan/chitin deacetylase (PgdA/CDA1 family)